MFREHCTYTNGIYVKDLKRLNRDLNDVIIIDNSPLAFHFDVSNGLPIISFIDDISDKELYKLDFILESLAQVNDVRMFIPLFVKNQEINFFKAKDLFLVEKRHISHLKYFTHCNTFTSNKAFEEVKSVNFEAAKSESFLQRKDDYFLQDEAKDKTEEEKSLEVITRLEDKTAHLKCKTISTIAVKKLAKSNLNSEKNKSDQSIISKPIGNSYIAAIQVTQSKNNATQLGKIKLSDKDQLYSSIREVNAKIKESAVGVQLTSSSRSSRISGQDHKKFSSQKLAYDCNLLGKSLQSHFRSDKNSSKKGLFRILDHSLNKSNARDNSKTSLESKYSKRTANIKISKISRNFKNEGATSTKILRTSPPHSKFSTSKDKKTASSSALKRNSNKILGVKVYQINSTKIAKSANFGNAMNCSTTPNKTKYSAQRSITYTSTYANFKKKTDIKEKGNKFSASQTNNNL